MKILVDELPETPKECLFVGAEYDMPYNQKGYECTLSCHGHKHGSTCPGVKKCEKLEVRTPIPRFSTCCY